jgi:hypothetical protein
MSKSCSCQIHSCVRGVNVTLSGTSFIPSHVQALEASCSDALAQLTASEEPEEKAAARKALDLLLSSVSRTPPPVPKLGLQAAADSAAKHSYTAPPAEGENAAKQPAARYQQGGGVPTGNLFALVQLVAMPGDAGASVDIAATLHALRLATESEAAQRELVACAPACFVPDMMDWPELYTPAFQTACPLLHSSTF